MNEILKQLTIVFSESLSRCEHCGKEGEVFDCDDCKRNKEDFASHMTDLINKLSTNGDVKLLVGLEVLELIL